ncbi:MAG TPA: type II toxin-antitoxin system RelE/ParE family toxin [Azospirillum sp.]|nr:type II toxin-antitoxin system RelE/ParE family toxin [Azospirillum sp.]
MLRVRRTDRARTDLEEIWWYVAQDSVAAADRLIRAIDETFRRLSEHPAMGRSRESLQPNLRSHPHGSYVVFYRPVDGGIEVVRVLHGARDIDAAFSE